MNNLRHKTMRTLMGLAAFCALALTASSSFAAGIVFHNDLKYPVLVQGTSVVNGVTVRGPQLFILPGKKAYDGQLSKGYRFVTVYDGNVQNQKLHHQQIYFQGGPFDVHYNISHSPIHLNKIDIVPNVPKKN